MSFEFGQDVMFTELMLYAPMDILEHVAEAQRESILADMQEEDAEIFGESVHVRKSGKRMSKQARKFALSDQERHSQKGRDRMHGKRHGNRQVKCLTRKRYLEKGCLRTNIHRDTVPIPEQEPFYVGIYETRKLSDGITCTMEWDFPEAVQGEAI